MPAKVSAIAQEISKENQPANEVVECLQRQVANILYTNYKHYHWQTFGPLFRDLHKLFDDLAEGVLKMVDEFAERIRMIGQDPVHGLRMIGETASVQEAKSGRNMREMVEEADANLVIVIKEMRDAVRTAEEQNDPGTVELLSNMVQVHEKHEWFLREILKKRDGFCS